MRPTPAARCARPPPAPAHTSPPAIQQLRSPRPAPEVAMPPSPISPPLPCRNPVCIAAHTARGRVFAQVLGLILIVVLAIYLYTLWGVNATTAALEAELLAKKRLQDGGKQSIGPGRAALCRLLRSRAAARPGSIELRRDGGARGRAAEPRPPAQPTNTHTHTHVFSPSPSPSPSLSLPVCPSHFHTHTPPPPAKRPPRCRFGAQAQAPSRWSGGPPRARARTPRTTRSWRRTSSIS